MRGRAMFGCGALLAVVLTLLGCDSFPGGRMTIEATEEQQACTRALELPGARRIEYHTPESTSYHWTQGGPSVGTSERPGRVSIEWGWQNYEPLRREIQDLLVHVRELRDLMVSQCGVDPSTIACVPNENVGHLCP